MKHLKSYKLFENHEQRHYGFPETKEEVEEELDNYHIKNYTVNDDLSVDVNGDVFLTPNYIEHDAALETEDGEPHLKPYYLKHIPVNFNKVTGDFDCSENQLTTLKGSPVEVGGYFDCSYNRLTSLEYKPVHIGGEFHYKGNNIKE